MVVTREKKLGNLNGFTGGNFAGNVYDKDMLCPTISACSGGNTQPMVVDEKEKPIVVDMYNDRQIDGDVCGTLTAHGNTSSTHCGTFGIVEQTKRQDRIKAKKMPNGNIRFFQDNDSKSAVSELQLQSGDDVAQTITTLGNAKVYETERYRIRKLTEIKGENKYEAEKNSEGFKTSPREILCLLREKIGAQAFSEWALGGLRCFLQTEVLRKNMYAKSVLESWNQSAELEQFSFNGEKYEQSVLTENKLRNLWKDWEIRCTSYRRRLSEQQYREFENFMQKLSYKNTSPEEIVLDLWEASEGIGVLRQALSEIQKVWESFDDESRAWSYRIRKLTPRETWRLMNFSDEDFEKAEKVVSSTQLYKEAGNSIPKCVLMAIFSQMNIKGVKPWNEREVTLSE